MHVTIIASVFQEDHTVTPINAPADEEGLQIGFIGSDICLNYRIGKQAFRKMDPLIVYTGRNLPLPSKFKVPEDRISIVSDGVYSLQLSDDLRKESYSQALGLKENGIEPGKTGLVFEKQNSVDQATQIEKAISQFCPPAPSKHGFITHFAHKNYSWSNTVKALHTTYQSYSAKNLHQINV